MCFGKGWCIAIFREETTPVLAVFRADPLSWSNWNLKMLAFAKGRKHAAKPEKHVQSKARTNNKLNPGHIGVRRAFSPLRQPCYPNIIYKPSINISYINHSFYHGYNNYFKDVCANCFRASLLRTQIYKPRHAWARALSNKMNNHRADGHCYNFAWIWRSWTFICATVSNAS